MTSPSASPNPQLFQPALPWIAILGFAGLTALCLVAQQGGVLNLLFPAGSLAVAALLYWRYPLMYVSFTWWIWFISAWVRRLADFYGGGWVDPSPVLLAPLLTTLVSGFTFWRCIRQPATGLPFLLAIASVSYGLLIGLVINPFQAAVLNFVGWASPVFFGFHLFTHWRDYPAYRQTLQRTFLWGVLVMGVYGIIQYLVAPPWDQLWMTNALEHAGLNVIGEPKPLAIRVFSTLNSPQPFAAIMSAGLLLLLASASQLKPFAIGSGAIAILLSLARSAWLSLIMGLLVLVPSLKSSLQIRLVSSLVVLSLLIIPVVRIEPFASAVLPRIQGLSKAGDDDSARSRAAGYQMLLGEALSSVTGNGLGFSFEGGSIGSRDSGILTLWFSLGWLGAVPYLFGVFLLLVSLFQTSVSQFDLFSSAARAIAVSTFAQIGLNPITAGHLAIVMWSFLGISAAARQYHTWQKRTSPEVAPQSAARNPYTA